MCGIAGMLASGPGGAPDGEVVRRMCDAMVHRGPDDHGYLTNGACALGDRRLSIIDLRPEGLVFASELGALAESNRFDSTNQRIAARAHRAATCTD